MSTRFKWVYTIVLLVGILCHSSFGQSVYPPIRVDSTRLDGKTRYFQSLAQSGDHKGGPNIVVIVADDLGKNDLNLYFKDGLDTPNINQLAEEGIVFTEAYSTSAVCNPSRAGMITGRYQQRFGNERQIMGRYARNKFEFFAFKTFVNTRPLQLIEPWYTPSETELRKQGLPVSEISLFEAFHSVGYTTACFGKWHLGYNEPFLPQNKGVDEFYGFYEAFSLYEPTRSKDIVNHKHRIFQNKMIWRQKRSGPSAIVRNGEEVEENEYLTKRIAEEACQFIKTHEEDPFLLYVPFSAPHTPFQAPKSYCDRFSHVKDLNKRVYFAMIAALDDAIGEIIEQVKESGIEENTLVFFCSDNGGATYTGATDNGDLKGGKMTNFEGGLNVPFIIKWKGTLSAGAQYHTPVSLMDIFTTALSACTIPAPTDIPIDGVDLIPFLTGEREGVPHEFLFWKTDFNKSVRSGKWKLIVNSREDQLVLYDLEADKQEHQDLKATHSEVVEHLLSKLTEWESELVPPLWPGVMEYEEEFDGVKMRFAF
ncbi:MAG: sulfatase [Bacteroidia bacterium]|nr:MAG: sulfatase [Bacteroidia bacterium]